MIDRDIEKEALFSELKILLKSQKMSYKDIADSLGMAESSIKRIFSKKDCSLDKLIEIGNVVGISLVDLFDLVKRRKLDLFSISKEAELFFLENLEYYFFFSALIYLNDVEKCRSLLNFSKTKSQKILIKLDKLGLISYFSDENFYCNFQGSLDLKEDSKLYKALVREFAKSLPEILKIDVNDLSTVKVNRFPMRESTFQKFREEFLELYDRYRRISQLDFKAYPVESNLYTVFNIMIPATEVLGFPKPTIKKSRY